ncbi:DEAD/DEAH box helicase [Oceanidesulfovibrio marinus]|uniref:Restriction endonuclease subunit R n=1 Tax=Oceanidesulfovibrio marinus TaxID=370038 RepID=A0ABX6NGR6_9BACT|nr:DEAD/DEAH box helicase family protein [Oceanidesulfovibrio marinus]QJT09416.1 restriction endonuclease subunit R [Oceanidesulfovibrio marinus]
MFQLKTYQHEALKALETYLENARLSGDPKKAFEEFIAAHPTDTGQQSYLIRRGMDGVPYVCLRLPTGGGKTVLASHSIEVAARAYLEQEYPVVLWLVPTNTIREQTIEALKQNDHPYREAIDNAFDGRVSVFDIDEVTQIRPKDLEDKVSVIVGTLQTLRVKKTEERRIYAHNENFEPHFAKIPSGMPGLEKAEDGTIKFSFANILHYHRPLIIMDEAHKATTSLSAETVERINPSCVIEFTATPITGNVLYRVTPTELKAEEMVKLPFMLTEHENWRNAVNRAVTERRELEALATGDANYIRPIALIQAEPKDGEATVEVIKAHLMENENVAESSIAIATGNQRELDGINLYDKRCPIKYVITIQALKEGWDCPFAYVFCSAQRVRSAVDIEQLLGRVMRMPYAKRRQIEELNKAYAHVISPGFAEAAQEMHDKLINMGFEDEEALDNIYPMQGTFEGFEDTPLGRVLQEPPALVLEAEAMPDLSRVNSFDGDRLHIQEVDGKYQIRIAGDISQDQVEELVSAFPESEQPKTRRTIEIHRYKFQRELPPYEQGVGFAVPLLGVMVEGDLELASPDLCLELHGWDLLDYPAQFEGNEFVYNEESRTFEFDIKGNKVEYSLADETPIYQRGYLSDRWDEPRLVRWLDKELHKMGEGAEFRQEVMLEFIRRCVASLLNSGDFDILALVRAKFLLAKALFEKIRRYRQQAYARGFQATLLEGGATVETSFSFSFDFRNSPYPSAGESYRGAYRFKKHYYGNDRIRDLKDGSEEFHCAQAIDAAKEVKHWVRNLPWGKEFSFRLPTSTDFFYPDFVAELEDGRLLAVEYKGRHIQDTADTREKDNIGKLWEAKSGGRCLFLLGVNEDEAGRDIFAQIQAKLS